MCYSSIAPIHLDDIPKNSEPFQQTNHAWHSRSPTQHAGDLITTGAIETGLFITTAGIGNLAIRGASKLPYLLKAKVPTATQYIKSQKESQLSTIKLEDGTKVNLTNFDYGTSQTKRPTKFKQKISQKVDSTIGKKVRKAKFENDMYNHNLEKQSSKPKKDSRVTKFGRKVKVSHKLNEDKVKTKVKDKLPNPKLSKYDITKSIINTDAVRKIATKRLPTKDKGKAPKGESGWEYNRHNSDNFPAIDDKIHIPTKTTKTATKNKPTTKQATKQTKKSGTQTIVEEINLHPNRPQPRTTEPKLGLELSSNLQSSEIDVSDATIQMIREKMKPKIGLGHSSRLQQRTNEQITPKPPTTKQKIDEIRKKRQEAHTRFSLDVFRGSRENQEWEEKYGIVTTPRTTPRFSFKLDEQTRVPKTPVTIGIKLPGIDDITKSNKKAPTGKLKKGFYRWNVDTERVGVYLPTADLHTGKTSKVIKRVDRLQTKTHTKKYQNTKEKRHNESWSFGFKSEKDTDLFRKKSGNSLFTRKSPTRKPKKKGFWSL